MRVINFLTSFLPFFKPASSSAEPSLSIDHSCRGYSASNVVTHGRGLTADLDLIGKGCGIYGPDLPHLRLTVEYETDSRLHVLIQDRKGERYQIPDSILPPPKTSHLTSKGNLKFIFHANPFTFQVLRRSTSEVLFDTTATSLIFERQYLRLKTWLPSNPNIYGLGEHTDPFRLYNEDYTRTFWTRDAGGVPYRQNLYGSHPVYVEHRRSGTHGVFLKNSNGMDIKLEKDEQGRHGLEYNVIGGVLDFYFFSGPGPREVARQYAEVVGTPALVPYWSLGFHQCKYGYRDWFEVAEVVHNYSTAGIPLETIWSDIDYMDHRRIFSLDEGNFPIDKMQELIKYLHNRDQHYIVMIDPAVAEYDYRPYNRGIEMDVFVKDKKGKKPYRGVVWPGVTVFPDWLHPKATKYWVERFQESFNPETGVDIDGIWIDMNEPANFCRFPCTDPEQTAKENGLPPNPPPVREPPRSIPGLPSSKSPPTIPKDDNDDQEPLQRLELRSTADQRPVFSDVDHAGDNLLSPPYHIANSAGNGELSDLTMPTNLRHASGHWTYDTHNLYGMMMGMATRTAMLARRPNVRPLIITRSTFAGAGKYMSKWLGDNFSRWDHYRAQIPQMLAFASIFQIPMVGSDVCGFLGAPSENLCARWATLGAFNPFFRNHADQGSPNQEFYLWESVTSAAKYAIDIRYRLLDYLYTALARQTEDGTPSLSPLWHWYPHDENTWGIDMQFFYGHCVMISPVTGDDAKDVDIYLPDDLFYNWDDHQPIRGRGAWTKIKDVPFDRIPIHIRGGCIIPLRAASTNTTTQLREQPFEILVAPGLDGRAKGMLYLDDGESLDGGKDKKLVHFEYMGGKVMTRLEGGEEMSLEDVGIDVAKVTVLEAWSDRDDREEL